MRLVNADELMEHVYRDKLDTRELIAKMIENTPTVVDYDKFQKETRELKAQIDYLRCRNNKLEGENQALAFAVRCNGVSGDAVRYE